jgi:nicotinamide-nucleotide adenylyltransferase
MTNLQKTNSKRGLVIEKCQPLTRHDINLAKKALDNNDELIFCIGSAGLSHSKLQVMTAGERVELTDFILRKEGLDPSRYYIIPIEDDHVQETGWVAEIMSMTPRWDTYYTRNFKNGALFHTFQKQHGIEVKLIDEQKPDYDVFDLYAKSLTGDKFARNMLKSFLVPGTLDMLKSLGIDRRVAAIYNRKPFDTAEVTAKKRALFLGGFQPFTGDYAENTGHMSNVELGLSLKDQVIIAIGSAQDNMQEKDPLTAGQRIETIRYALIANGVQSDQFYIIPIKNISDNSAFSTKVATFCPSFDSVIAGNDWTKELFSRSRYEIIPVTRNTIKTGSTPISATYVRQAAMETIKQRHSRDEAVSETTISEIESKLKGFVDKHMLVALKNVGFYQTMHFLAYAKE